MSKTTGNISVTANSHIFVDLLRFRSRSDVETNVNGMITKYSTLSFQSRETTINFNLIDNECRCTIQNHTSLERACVQKSNVLQQDTILDLDASKIQWKYSNGESGWVIRSQKMPQDECFPLSVSHNDGSGLVEEFFNMKSSVDESVFNIPSICPPVSASNESEPTSTTQNHQTLLIDIEDLRATPTEQSYFEELNGVIERLDVLTHKLSATTMNKMFKMEDDSMKLTKIAGHVVPKELWDVVNALLRRTFLNIHSFSNFDKAGQDLEKLKTISDQLELLVIVNTSGEKPENEEESEKQMVDRLKGIIVLLEKENEVYIITNKLLDLQRQSFEVPVPSNEDNSENPLENQILKEANKNQEVQTAERIDEIRTSVLELLERRYSIYKEFGNAKEAHTDLCNAIELLEDDIKKLGEENSNSEKIAQKKEWVARLLVDRAELYFTFIHSLYQGPQVEQVLSKDLSQKQRAAIVLDDINSKLTQLAELLGAEEVQNDAAGGSQKQISMITAAKYQAEADERMKKDLKMAKEYDPNIGAHHNSYNTIQDFLKEIGDKRKRAGLILRLLIIAFVGLLIQNMYQAYTERKKEGSASQKQ
ncbi:hypothetical protein C9374_005027 [Naegleria lovaniensis]|uniref:Uncharacterized protein n=1 Tax=Naegleria lovaniensis TaxID=51637 RepID=A0AA88GQC8_NAELO|nr:uncharacterized protein C9374_005027 [Naegleria lovaniensis]KAG2382447.1 hypothetical protein C9374_005027 [Naegleria lovaniensis]